MVHIYAEKTELRVQEREPVTSGSVNACRVRFEFSEDWEGLARTAVFRCCGESVPVLLDESGECAVPWEVLVKPGYRLEAGVYTSCLQRQRAMDVYSRRFRREQGYVCDGLCVSELFQE